MMRIWVRGYLGLQTALGDRPFIEIDANQVTIGDLLDQLALRDDTGVPALGTGGHLAVLINGRHASHLPDKLDTVLTDGDQVAIFPPVAGG
jgi:molybdopterin converting factor small subunit